MQTQFILRMVLAVLAIKYVNAETTVPRGDFEFRLTTEDQSFQLESNYELSLILERLGIVLDEESEVFVHNEENFVNLDCFNCIISNIGHNEEVQHSFNMRQIGK